MSGEFGWRDSSPRRFEDGAEEQRLAIAGVIDVVEHEAKIARRAEAEIGALLGFRRGAVHPVRSARSVRGTRGFRGMADGNIGPCGRGG